MGAFFIRNGVLAASLGMLSIVSAGAISASELVEGFTEPFRTVHVASAETGLLQSLLVKVGDHVARGQLVASLDDDLQRVQLAIAQQQLETRGRLKVAEAERAL